MDRKFGLCCVFVCAVIAIAGCGFEDTADVEEFAGTWSWNDGSSRDINCPNGNVVQSFDGNETFVEGNNSDLVLATDGCNLDFNVSGNTASIVSGQSCEFDNEEHFWSNWTFTRSGDQLSVSASGTIELDSGEECSLSINGSLNRVGG